MVLRDPSSDFLALVLVELDSEAVSVTRAVWFCLASESGDPSPGVSQCWEKERDGLVTYMIASAFLL